MPIPGSRARALPVRSRYRAIAITAFALSLLLALAAREPARADVTLWHAASSVFPDQMPCPWTKVTNTTPAPAFSGGALVLSTAAVSGNTYYQQVSSALAMPPDSLVIETEIQFVSGGTSNSTRAPAAVEIEVSAFRGTVFFVGSGEIFFNNGANSRGG